MTEVRILPKLSELIIASFTGTEHEFRFNQPIYSENPLEIAIHYLSTFNLIPNVVSGSSVTVTHHNTETLEIIVPQGYYEITRINDYVKYKLEEAGIEPKSFELEPDVITGKSTITLSDPINSVDLSSSLETMFGFEGDQKIETGINKSENI